jgi:hypothetical protein
MNRRELLAGGVAVTVLPAIAQQGISGVTNGSYIVEIPPAVSMEERKRQYAICKERGHVPEIDPSQNVIAIYPPPPPRMICKYCGTEVWTETIQHEKGAPE